MRALKIVARIAALLVGLSLTFVLALHVFLNVWLTVVINQRPERIRLTHEGAWMVGWTTVEVRNLEIRQQGPKDQWLLTVDRATATFQLDSFLKHTVHITEGEVHGASFRWRARTDAAPTLGPGPEAGVAFTMVPGPDLTPPVPGLTNPPVPTPESLGEPAKPWRVQLDHIHAVGVEELWLSDYRYVGDATVSGGLTLEAHVWLEVRDVVFDMHGGDLIRGSDTLLRDITGRVGVDLTGTDPTTFSGTSVFGALSGTAAVEAEVANLAFLDFYLRAAPWLRLSGGLGRLSVNVAVEDGAFRAGSTVSASVRDIVARFLSYSVVGDGAVKLIVADVEGVPNSSIAVDFLDFAIRRDGDSAAHVQGQGFRVEALSPDVALDRPFTSLAVMLHLPEAQIPDVGVYNSYLPAAAGLSLVSGTGSIRGTLVASTVENTCSGELHIVGTQVRATLDSLAVSGDLSLTAKVPNGNLDTGVYDISGTRFELRHVRVITEDATSKASSRDWWANVNLGRGKVSVGAATFFDGTAAVAFRDTVPFVTIFSEKQKVPGWIGGLLRVRPASGSARIRLGDDVVRVSDFKLKAGPFDVFLELASRDKTSGKLLAQYGGLSVALGLSDGQSHIQLLRAKPWYDAQPDPK